MSLPTKWNFGFDLFPSMKSMFDDFVLDMPENFGRLAKLGTSFPATNMHETEDSYELEVATPGLNKEDLNISLKNNVLTLFSESKTEVENKSEEKNYSRREFSFQSFKRSFTLPENADSEKIEAHYDNGVLHLSVPKKATTQQDEAAQSIEIK